MDSVKKASGKQIQHHPSSRAHKALQKSSTLNRKFVKRPVVKAQIAKRQQLEREAMLRRQALAAEMDRKNHVLIARKMRGGVNLQPVGGVKVQVQEQIQEQPDEQPVVHPTVAVVNARVAARKAAAPRQLTAQELKDRAIAQALQRVAIMGKDDATDGEQIVGIVTKRRGAWKKRKLFIAVAMSVASIALLGYLVYLNLPDLSVRVAALQSGIDSAYPSYVPKGYKMDGLVAENSGKVTITFAKQDGQSFNLIQEKSSWDSVALHAQFVASEWGDSYSTIKEQGLTIYVSESSAVWVNGGIFYHIDDLTKSLTKQELRDIAISL